jgi:uncharacterized membrane protein
MSQSDAQPKGRLGGHAFAALGFLACLAVAAVIWRLGPPGQIPVHFDLHGRTNGWMDRTHLAITVVGLTAILAICYAAMGLLTGSMGRNLKTARLILVLVAVMTAVIMASAAFGAMTGPDFSPSRLQPAALSLMFLIIGALIGKASPNPMVGVRTYWALRSRLAWDKSNRLCGRLFFAIGALGLVASALAPSTLVIFALIVAILMAALISVVESWRVWRNDPDRLAP